MSSSHEEKMETEITDWRAAVDAAFVKRRQPPAARTRAINKVMNAIKPPLKFALPTLKSTRNSVAENTAMVEASDGALSSAERSATPNTIQRSLRNEFASHKVRLNLTATTSALNRSTPAMPISYEEWNAANDSQSVIRQYEKTLVVNTSKRTSTELIAMQTTQNAKAATAADSAPASTVSSADPADLYKVSVSELEKLPLHFFDHTESDRTPGQWIAMGFQYHQGKGTPAKALFYHNAQWTWTPCRVHSYDEDTRLYTVNFTVPPISKQLPRLSILFDDEDANKFLERLNKCKILREECLSIRRYTAYIDSQPGSSFSPLSQQTIDHVIALLTQHTHHTAATTLSRRQQSIEKLIGEVKFEYARAIKAAIIERRRRTDYKADQQLMDTLRLPPLTQPSPPSYFAQIDIATANGRLLSLTECMRALNAVHYNRRHECSAVILSLLKNWAAVSQHSFYDWNKVAAVTAENVSAVHSIISTSQASSHHHHLTLPSRLTEYVAYQNTIFENMKERLQNDFRSYLINLIRDHLTNIYKLFVNDTVEYDRSELKRYLTVTQTLCQTLLNHHILLNIEDLSKYFKAYEKPKMTTKALIGNSDQSFKEMPVVNTITPLFVVTLTVENDTLCFNPPLETIGPAVQHLFDIPSKLTILRGITHDVVPLLSLNDVAMVTLENSPTVFEATNAALKSLQTIVQDNCVEPNKLFDVYQQFAELLSTAQPAASTTTTVGYLDSTLLPEEIEYRQQQSLDATRSQLQRYVDTMERIHTVSPNTMNFGLLQVDCSLAKTVLISRCQQVYTQIADDYFATYQQDLADLKRFYDLLVTKMDEPVHDVFAMDAMRNERNKIETVAIPNISKQINYIQQKLIILLQFRYRLPANDYYESFQINLYPMKLRERLTVTSVELDLCAKKFQDVLLAEQETLNQNLEQFNAQINEYFNFTVGTSGQMETQAALVESLSESLDQAEQLIQTFNARDSIFGEVSKEYSHFHEIKSTFTPLFELWSTVSLYQSSVTAYMTGSFHELDAEQISLDITNWSRNMNKLERSFTLHDQLKPAKVATELKNKINEFKQNLPIIQSLRCPGLQQRHWDKLNALFEVSVPPTSSVAATAPTDTATLVSAPGTAPSTEAGVIPPTAGNKVILSADAELTLAQILTLDGVLAKRPLIEDICETATKEFALEEALDKMVKEWRNQSFVIDAYKQTHTYILRQSEDILTLIDDQIMKTQSIRGSPFIKHFELRAKKWEAKLQLMNSIMEEWLNCQKVWLYLEPIFSSEDILKQMPVEGRRFGVVDAYWRKTMENARKISNVLEFLSENEAILKTFIESNKMLELIGKHLNEYLETKRLIFPRFYFLSNEELLSILSQTKKVTAVQPHLSKCFDAMNKLQFDSKNDNNNNGRSGEGEATTDELVISGMFSGEGEYVEFNERIEPCVGPMKGNVELWLREVERVMRSTLQKVMIRSISSYAVEPRQQWILNQCGQICLAVSQMYWTNEVESVLATGGLRGLRDFMPKLNAQLNQLVQLVRGELTDLNRLTLGALTVIDVHARDVVQRLIDEKVKSTNDFEWLAQMRYYFESPQLTSATDASSDPGLIFVKMLNSSMQYGYEYLGNSTRLVITPLTDRCYRTLMGAIHLQLGGAPEGPAGTGKTETVKDLSKAVAQMCIVFNCSDALNYRSMAKFFKGLATSGAWSCFDEFNRIDIEVLSVIAQQIGSIQRAIAEGKQTFVFEGASIPLIHTCSVFITMNPGYAGRAELPDNLKALFRTVAMMIPDYALIAEIVLYSCGYSEARQLARKLVACLRLSSEQLSSQDHYDFGMRNVKSILTAAGKLKHDMPDEPEDWLCVRAICDCNVPKFVSADIALFNGIVKDLFPQVDMRTNERTTLLNAVKESIVRGGLQAVPAFIAKCMELYDTVTVRHGIMLVGHTMSGKSSAIRSLQSAITSLKGSGSGNHTFNAVNTHVINPKAVDIVSLYGADNPSTNEWMDGVLPVVMRSAVQDTQEHGHWQWIIFDGPVDAIWIENMNTVLDDNKKLCLASGEQIKLVNHMSIMFEVEDLSQASPATVSRCGMVYMEPQQLGVAALVDSWIAALPPALTEQTQLTAYARSVLLWLIAPSLTFVRQNCTQMIAASDLALVSALLKLVSSHLDGIINALTDKQAARNKSAVTNAAKATVDGEEETIGVVTQTDSEMDPVVLADYKELIDCVVAFSIVWSIGCNTNSEDRTAFSTFFRSLLKGTAEETHGIIVNVLAADKTLMKPFPESGLVFDYFYDEERTHGWIHWMELESVTSFAIPANALSHEIIVPTIDTVRLNYLLDVLIAHDYHTLITGATGTGKSISAQAKLLRGLDTVQYTTLSLAFSARTSASGTQDLIDNKLERRRAGVIGPPSGKKCVIFVDDLNMPARDTYGAQPPIELLRQWMDYRGWYDRKVNTFRQLVDIQFLAAMGPPSGGRNPITPRYTRHFNNICMAPYDQNSLKRIFNTILSWWTNGLSADIQSTCQLVVDATVKSYATIQAELLPTPAKSHYTFNLRDVSKVMQGIMQVTHSSLSSSTDVVKLWVHECTRVFADRLVDTEDEVWFNQLVDAHIINTFQLALSDVFPSRDDSGNKGGAVDRRQIFCDFSDPKALKKSYRECTDLSALSGVMEEYLGDYNNNEKNGMDLCLFSSAIDHVARIARILRAPYGNALLVGVGGSGRQSLTRLAAFIMEYECKSIEMNKNYGWNEWREDLRKLMRLAGLSNKQVVFLLSDAQIKEETFVEDINNILNTGEIPNLFPAEEVAPIIEAVLPDARKAGRADNNAMIFQFFIDRCRTNIHVVLCFSPVGNQFRNRLRQFPSLVNCTTIDWFKPWPNDALKQVATRFFKDVDLEADIKDGVIDVCVDMQQRVIALSHDYLQSLRRYNYVTPTSYLELIKLFRTLFESSRQNIAQQEQRYTTGLAKLQDTEVQVKAMQVQLEALKPELIVSSQETDALMATIEQRSAEVAQTKETVSVEEAECNATAAEAEMIKADCEEQLKEALPALQNAMNALRVLKKSALDELKAMKVPTPAVILTIEALCIMMGVEPKKVGTVGAKSDDYWEPAKKKLLNDPQLFVKLQNYDKDHIPTEVINKVRPYCKNPEFSPPKVAKASQAAEGFCKWVLSMEVYDRVAKQIEPKRQALAVAEETLRVASEKLAQKKAQLSECIALLDDLNNQFTMANQKKQSLEQQVKECSDRLDRAEKLLGGLSSEKSRWKDKQIQLQHDLHNVVGNILVSSGVIAYLGVFTSTYRDSCIKQWLDMLNVKKIKCDTNFVLHRILGAPVTIRQWHIHHLPKDTFSIDNALILTKSMRFGLMIDPQEQANKWIKSLEDEKAGKLKVVRQTDDNFAKVLTNCITMGFPLLIESVNETIDPILEPVLLKQTFKQGSSINIRLANEIINYDTNFRLYLTSKLDNPHYNPETSTKVTLINFMITPAGLEDQMLNTVVSAEEPALESERSELIVKSAENSRQLQVIEDKILEKLNESKGMILDDEELISTLSKSKQAAKTIEKRVIAAAKTEENINKTRMSYSGVAFSSSNLFFCVSELSSMDPMYQYSLHWFIHLFLRAIKEAEKSLDVHVRTANIEKHFLKSLYANVCRSLFEKDKLLFSFMLCLRVMMGRGQLDNAQLRFLLTGGPASVAGQAIQNPTDVSASASGEKADEEEEDDEDDGSDDEHVVTTKVSSTSAPEDDIVELSGPWLSDVQWQQVLHLSSLSSFSGISSHIASNQRKWRLYFESSDPFSRQLPAPFDGLSPFQKLCILRCFRADKMIPAIQQVVALTLGKEFISPPPFDLGAAYADSDATSPIVFILSPGVDPAKEVFKLASEMGINSAEKLVTISLGQGQGPLAETAIREAIDKGSWVLLQNAHLLNSWMPALHKIVDEINPTTTNPDFRLFLTSMPTPHFPVSILQNGVKITNEPPRGIKANISASYRLIDEQTFETCRKSEEYKRLLYGLCFFHAVVQERRKFGAVGWNRAYEFTSNDLAISKTQLRIMLETYDVVPYAAINYLIGQLNYGGRVTDDWDRRCLSTILTDYCHEHMMEPAARLDARAQYTVPPLGADLNEYRIAIAEMPSTDDSDVFGLHSNVSITCAMKENHQMFATLLTLQPRTVSDGALSREEILQRLVSDITAELPEQFDIAAASEKYPVTYTDSMNTVLVQELVRFNKLTATMKKTLSELCRALKGQSTMSVELDRMAAAIFDGAVPSLWAAVAYPSLKPLGGWVTDLKKRLLMFSDWLKNGPPPVFWLSGFFFTQSFLTGAMQNFARKHRIAIDECAFEFDVVPHIKSIDSSVVPPDDGVYVDGLYLDGARWDVNAGALADPLRRELYSSMPTIHIKPMRITPASTMRLTYACPLYKTSQRAGTLSTTGHSTNFVIAIALKSNVQDKHWIKRGVALLTQLDN